MMTTALPFIIALAYILVYAAIYFGHVVPASDDQIRATAPGQFAQCREHVARLDSIGARPWYYLALKQIKPISALVLVVAGTLFLWNGV